LYDYLFVSSGCTELGIKCSLNTSLNDVTFTTVGGGGAFFRDLKRHMYGGVVIGRSVVLYSIELCQYCNIVYNVHYF
jgi:hypothetical protein